MARFTRIISRTSQASLLFAVLFASGLAPVHAQDASSAASQVGISAQPAGAAIHWEAGTSTRSVKGAAETLPVIRYNGYELPMQIVPLALSGRASVRVTVQQLEAERMATTITPAAPLLPPALDWEPDPNVPPAETVALPTAPVFVLREGEIRGQAFAVVALSPIFVQDGNVMFASRIDALVPGARVLAEDPFATTAESASGARTMTAELVDVPVNTDALKTAARLTVSRAGIHEVRFSEVGGVANPNALRLTHRGVQVAIEVLSDRFRFYVPAVGDRWNTTSVYWLTFDSAAPLRIVAQAAAPAGAPGAAYEQGRWLDNQQYESVYAGPDNDHWFNADLRSEPASSIAGLKAVTVPVSSLLPTVGGTTTYSIGLTAFIAVPGSQCNQNYGGYRLGIDFGGGATQVINWNPMINCILQPNWLVSTTTTASTQALVLRLLPSTHPSGIKLDHVAWEQPVTLDFGGKGADFWGPAGAWSFLWSNLPGAVAGFKIFLPSVGGRAGASQALAAAVAPGDVELAPAAAPAAVNGLGDWRLYDVTDPLQPVIVAATESGFNQALSPVPRHYVLAQLGALGKPTVVRHTPVNFGDVGAANAIYISPKSFTEALQPLLTLRQNQGYVPLFVDVQSIFDVYGYGYRSATAIRNFLRARTDWQNTQRKLSVVLVGDGTYDPYSYEGKRLSDVIPPYMADVDPYLIEAPCEPCIAQLNGDDPVTGDNKAQGRGQVTNWFAADIWLGRFPVRDESELTDVVKKIVSYETAPSANEPWRRQQIYLADNYIRTVDSNNNANLDPAGDFGRFSDQISALAPSGAQRTRVYFDSAPARKVVTGPQGQPLPVGPSAPGMYKTVPRVPAEPWRTNDNQAANTAAIRALSEGAGLAIFNGHSNHWQYAYTGENGGSPTWLLLTNDVDLLTNDGKPFIALAMTCYTSQFPKPADAGTLDELLFRRPDGGAVAVWGPAGLTVVHGHDLLQRGFMQHLWSKPTNTLRLGELTEAGYTELLTYGPSYLDALQTFLLLGDPLTKSRIVGQPPVYLPMVGR